MPIVWLLYPEVAGRTLEEVNLLFAADSPLVAANYREYQRRLHEARGNVALAERNLLDEVDEKVSEVDLRRGSVVEKTPMPNGEHSDAKFV